MITFRQITGFYMLPMLTFYRQIKDFVCKGKKCVWVLFSGKNCLN